MHCHLGLKDETVKSLGFLVWTGLSFTIFSLNFS